MADPSRRGGSGLGLAIAAENAALLGGDLLARNRSGGGLEIQLRLPVTQPLPRRRSDGDPRTTKVTTDQPPPHGAPDHEPPETLTSARCHRRSRSPSVVAACGGGSGTLGTLPPGSVAPEPSVAQGSPDVTRPRRTCRPPTRTPPRRRPAGPIRPTPSADPGGTTIVRAYLWLGGLPGSEGLVAVLREVPATKSVATAAINALFAGPTSAEAGRGDQHRDP